MDHDSHQSEALKPIQIIFELQKGIKSDFHTLVLKPFYVSIDL